MATRQPGSYSERKFYQYSSLTLPRWAQQYIALIHDKLERSQEASKVVGWKPVGKRAQKGCGILRYQGGGVRQLLGPEDSDVFVRTSAGEFILSENSDRVTLVWHLRPKWRGLIEPGCSNVITIVPSRKIKRSD